MSNLQVFAVYDAAASAYIRPFFVPTRGIAERAFAEAVNDPNEQMNKYPGDYSLFHLGEYDEQHGKMIPLEANVCIGNALEYYKLNEIKEQQFADLNNAEAPEVSQFLKEQAE